MRIEKINEKQIRCTLNQKDLKDREIGISELAYGTAKAKALYRDMMEQASYELGFDADDIPLMIEAIPLLPEALVLVITKVEDPDELDTLFSCFTEEKDWAQDDDEFFYDDLEVYDEDDDEDDIMTFDSENDDLNDDVIWKFPEDDSSNLLELSPDTRPSDKQQDFISLPEALGMEPRPKEQKAPKPRDIAMIFAFSNLTSVTQLASHIHTMYHGENTLYKDSTTNTYYLVLHRSADEAEEFGKVCNILYEYGTLVKNSGANQYYYEEHFKPIITKNAIQVLADL